MKKIKLIQLILFFITLVSCEQDKIEIKKEEQFKVKIERKSINTLLEDHVFKESIIQFGISEFWNKKRTSNYSNKYPFKIDKNAINVIKKDNFISYTFLIKREHSLDVFENLVIEKRKDKLIGYFVKYKTKNNFLNRVKITKFAGSIHELISDIKSSKKRSNYSVKSLFDCRVEIFIETQCSCDGHWPGEYCSCGEAPTRDRYVFDTCEEDDEFEEENDPNQRGWFYLERNRRRNGNHNSGSNSNSSSGSTSPVYPCDDPVHGCDKFAYLKLSNKLNITDSDTIDFLENNFDFVDKLLEFLEANNSSQEALNFVKQVIKVKKRKPNTKIDFDIEPLITSGNPTNYVNGIKKMTAYLKVRGARELGEYIERLQTDFNSFTVGEIKDIYRLVRKEYLSLKGQYFMAIYGTVAKQAYPFIEYAIIEATLGTAIPMLKKIPISFVSRGAKLEKMVRKVAQLGKAGTNSRIRLIKNGNYLKAFELFKKITKDAKHIKVETLSNGRVIRIADMGEGNYITFRNFDYSKTPNLTANIDLNFPKIWSKSRELKFIR